MNVTINGNVSFVCQYCKKPHALENEAFSFKEDASAEAEEDDYIRYTSQVELQCSACASDIRINFDVWEFPEAVVNYSYYGVHKAATIDCEFSIEHYFDADALKGEDLQYELDKAREQLPENDLSEDNYHDGPDSGEAYIDHYENEE